MNSNGMEATPELADQTEAITETKETQVATKNRDQLICISLVHHYEE